MAKGKFVCTQCGTTGDGKPFTQGSILIELVLWCCFLAPGLIYSIWRLTTRKRVCTACRGGPLVPADSPVGIRLSRQQ